MATSRVTATNENIQTYGDGTRDYTAFSTWEASTDIDLVTATQSEVLECYDDATSFDDSLSMTGATTDASFFRIARPGPGQGHDGTAANGFHIIQTTNQNVMTINEGFSSVQDLIITQSINATTTRSAVLVLAAGTNSVVVGIIVDGSSNLGTGSTRGIQLSLGADDSTVVNCIVSNTDGDGYLIDSATTLLYNCNAEGNTGQGFNNDDVTNTLINCISTGNTGDDFNGAGAAASGYNISSDTTAIGTHSIVSQTPTYSTPGSDFHLGPADLIAIHRGFDLSADATFPFDDDIDGDTRTGDWDIGSDNTAVAQSSRHTAINENVSTYGGGGRDYTLFATWEAATDIDLVTAKQSEVLEGYTDSATYNDSIAMAGATSDSQYFRIIRPATGHCHTGKALTGFHITNTTSIATFATTESYTEFQDLNVTASINTASTIAMFSLNGLAARATGCLTIDPVNATGLCQGFLINNTADNFRVVNCISAGSTSEAVRINSGAINGLLFNSTFVDGTQTANIQSTTVKIINCIAAGGSILDWNASTPGAGSTNNGSGAGAAPGLLPQSAKVFVYVDAAGGDYHLDPTDTFALGNGADLTVDSDYPITDDIDKIAVLSTWSIGFDSINVSVGGGGGGANSVLKRRRRLLQKR